jgi:hypothetical protein
VRHHGYIYQLDRSSDCVIWPAKAENWCSSSARRLRGACCTAKELECRRHAGERHEMLPVVADTLAPLQVLLLLYLTEPKASQPSDLFGRVSGVRAQRLRNIVDSISAACIRIAATIMKHAQQNTPQCLTHCACILQYVKRHY